jgi:hypothetical protein
MLAGIGKPSNDHGHLNIAHEVVTAGTPAVPPSYLPSDIIPCLIYFGLVDEDGDLIGSPQLMFSGVVSATSFIIDPGRAPTASIEIQGADGIVEGTTGRRYTQAYQKFLYPEDNGMEFVDVTAAAKLKFGGI